MYCAIEIAENPKENALAGIFGILLGFVGIRSAARGVWKNAAELRRTKFIKASDLASLGGSVKKNVELVDNIVKVCRTR